MKFNFNLVFLTHFWRLHPALYFGLTLFIAFTFHQATLLLTFISLFFLWAPSHMGLRRLGSIALFSSALLYHSTLGPLPPLNTNETGIATIQWERITPYDSFGEKKWLYSGKVTHFQSDWTAENSWQLIPLTLSFKKEDFIPPNAIYAIHGRLRSDENGRSHFFPDHRADWIPTSKRFSLIEKRHHWKESVRNTIQKAVKDPQAASLLISLSVGDSSEKQVQQTFRRFGLQHLLAISGFHFSLVAGLILLFLNLLMSRKWSFPLTFLLMTFYFLFLGYSPSIFRAYFMCSLFLLASPFRGVHSPLNALGVALVFLLILDPRAVSNPGFLFSFAVTASILLFYSPIEKALRPILQVRSFDQVKQMDRFNQHGYLAVQFTRSALALMVAVNITALPLTLFLFGSFPLLGLLYNIILPFFAAFALILLFIVLILYTFVPGLGLPLLQFNGHFTSHMIQILDALPTKLDVKLSISQISTELLSLYFIALLILGIFLNTRSHRSKQLFSFI